MSAENKTAEQAASRSSGVEGALVRIGTSTAGCATVGGAIGSFFGPAASGVGLAVGGVIGFIASTTDAVKSKSEK